VKRIAEKKKKVKRLFEAMQGGAWMERELKEVIAERKRSLDSYMMEIGKMLAETLPP